MLKNLDARKRKSSRFSSWANSGASQMSNTVRGRMFECLLNGLKRNLDHFKEKPQHSGSRRLGINFLSNKKGGIMHVRPNDAASQQSKCGNVIFAIDLA